MCDQCNALSQQLAARDRELAQARREIEQQKRRIMRLLKVVQVARGTCARYIREADKALSKLNRGGVPRGRWVYETGEWTGIKSTAYTLYMLLSQQ